MKKRKIIYALIAALFVGGLTGCEKNNNVVDVSNKIDDGGNSSKPSSVEIETPNNGSSIQDNLLTKKIFKEYKKSFEDITYDDFLANAKQYNDGKEILYKNSKIELDSDTVIIFKEINIGNKQTTSKFINNEWITVSESIYINGETRKVYDISLEFEEDGTFDSKNEYTYDESGKKLSCIQSSYEKGKWKLVYKYEYAYDESGRELSSVKSRYYREWELIYKYDYTYDHNGNKLTKIESKYENEKWVLNYKYEYTYDEKGNTLSCIKSTYENGEWLLDYKEDYIYDENGNELSRIESKYENEEWVLNYKHEYTYDEKGNELSCIESRYINNEWMEVSKSIYINGEKRTVYWIYFDSNDIYSKRYEYRYDEKGNRLSEIVSNYENGEWLLEYKYDNTYDENGNLKSHTISYYRNGEWIKEN